MKICEALDRIDMIKPNMVDPAVKVAWLSELDGMIYRELVMTHCRRDRRPYGHGEEIQIRDGNDPLVPETNTHHHCGCVIEPVGDFVPYDLSDITHELIVQFPYDGLYQHYLAMQIDIQNAEVEKYNNDSRLFNAAYSTFSDWYTRTHYPKQRVHDFHM